MLELRDVRKRVGRSFALGPISFEVATGRCLALVGPSGAGKTTTLRLIAGLEAPDAGVIRIGGEAVYGGRKKVAPHRRRVALVFQSLALWPHLTVEKQVFYGLGRGLPRATRGSVVRSALARLGIAEHARRYPEQLSGGERQRVAIARALAGRPKILLLDEPLANLDRGLRRSLLELLAELKSESSMAMVYVSHDREGLASLADRLAVMDRGVLVEQGPAAEVLASPATAVGKRLLAD
jgi:iron(III) transport system ATP-binding protein